MKKILIVVVTIMLAASFCYAADAKPKATEPVGAVVETAGHIVGSLTNTIEKSLGNKSLVMAEDNGTTKIIPLDNTVKVLDAGFHAVTLKQLKGRKVSVEVSKESGKAITVQEVK